MKTKQDDLAGADLGKYDDVDIFGLDEFGEATGLPAIYGAAIGSGVGTIAAIAVRSLNSTQKLSGYSELIGLGAGVAAGAAMVFWPGQHLRHAGWVAIASATLNNGLRAAEAYFKGLMGLSGAMIENVPRAAGLSGGLGLIQAEPLGSSGRQAMLMGAPPMNMLANSWGSNVYSKK